ncbi:MAG: hypothetical protein DRI97_01235 [Bacteroidetes bacterium]|nr:MAG: hypothetical protein DRI97_01235 [Bacteroidota bacterium]
MRAKPSKPIKRAAKAKAAATKKYLKGSTKTYKKGLKTAEKGVKQRNKASAASSREVSKGKSPSKRVRYKAMDADVKIREGSKAMANPKPKAKIKKKAYRTVPASGHGPGKYVSRKGKVISRKKRR